MYEAFYGLKAKPFRLTPDPRFLYISAAHKKALAYLRYGIYRSEGFVIVMGLPGTGKTTLVKAVVSELPANDIVVAKLMSTNMSADDTLRSFCAAIGVPYEGMSKAGLINNIEDFLRAQAEQGKHVLLMVDEAHKLSRDVLEELRMLTNFQQNDRALLQCFLIGQDELRELVTAPDMEQLQQRVIASCQLKALSGGETVAYIEHRLACAGLQGEPVFSFGAYERIHEWTKGVPRRINELCDRMLLRGFLDEQAVIEEALAVEVISEMNSERGLASELEDEGVLEKTLGSQVSARAAGGHSLRLVESQSLPSLSEQDVARHDASGGRLSAKMDHPIPPFDDELSELDMKSPLDIAAKAQSPDRPQTFREQPLGSSARLADDMGIPDIPEESDLEPQLQEVKPHRNHSRRSRLDNVDTSVLPTASKKHVHPDQAKFEATVYGHYRSQEAGLVEPEQSVVSVTKWARFMAVLKKVAPYLGGVVFVIIVLLLIFLPPEALP